MTPEMLLTAQQALRKNMADQQAYRAAPAPSHQPGRGEHGAYRAEPLGGVARLLGHARAGLATVFEAGRATTPSDVASRETSASCSPATQVRPSQEPRRERPYRTRRPLVDGEQK